jgi:hypothetical protein
MQRYPWDKWVDFEAHRIVQGTDFPVSVRCMQGQIYHRAEELAMEAVTWKRRPGELWFLFVDTRAD